jgi:hypothetical protein
MTTARLPPAPWRWRFDEDGGARLVDDDGNTVLAVEKLGPTSPLARLLAAAPLLLRELRGVFRGRDCPICLGSMGGCYDDCSSVEARALIARLDDVEVAGE